MKYLKISNKGLLDTKLLFLMGASTKKEDNTKIGQFGTGLKYAISYFLRESIPFHFYIGNKEYNFLVKATNVKGISIKEIYCNNTSMGITTEYGYQWETWEAIREIWCNALDEDDYNKKVVDGRTPIKGKINTTTIFIKITDKVKNVIDNWDKYFINNIVPFYENDKFAIYINNDTKLHLYKNNVLIHTSTYYNSIFNYDLKTTELNELRQYRGYVDSDISEVLLNSDKKVIDILLKSFSDKKLENKLEIKLDYSFYGTYFTDKLKDIFQSWVFLHPESNIISKDKRIKISKSLFAILNKFDLPCEKVKVKEIGGYYSGGSRSVGYVVNEKLAYKEVTNINFYNRIKYIINKYSNEIKIIIAVPLSDDDFEILIEDDSIIINSNLDILAEADLEPIILVGIIHNKEGNLYKILKRLIKIVLKSKHFKKIFFKN